MSIERDDGAERNARIERMIDEFRAAQTRRSGKQGDSNVESKPDANRPPLAGTAAPQ